MFWLQFHWILFLRVKTTSNHWFCTLILHRRSLDTFYSGDSASHYLKQWWPSQLTIHALPGFSGLSKGMYIIPAINASPGLNGLNEGFESLWPHMRFNGFQASMGQVTVWYHPDHICVTRPQWVKWRVGIIPTIYASSGLNGLSDGLVSSRPYIRHPASMG